jgi:hypothetical protein
LLRCRARCCDAGQPPPRLLAPHVINCRGIATAPVGTVCQALVALQGKQGSEGLDA